jgi:hypothetical protein
VESELKVSYCELQNFSVKKRNEKKKEEKKRKKERMSKNKN